MKVDARGMACPLPVVNAKKAVDSLTESEEISILVDNEIAVQNLLKFAAGQGFEAKSAKLAEKEYEVVINAVIGKDAEEAKDAENTSADGECAECQPDARKAGMVVVISSDRMGNGDDQLGRNLMKAFIFAVAKQDNLPETMLFYNSGAYLTCKDSDCLADIKNLEAAGVTIETCGTCLDYYGLKDKLAVGTVTNMFSIVETQEKASLIIKP